MKTTRVLTAVSAAALLGISSFALAQGTGGSAGGGAGASTGQSATGGGSTGGGAGSSGAPAGNTMQRQQDAPPAGTKSNRAQSKEIQQRKDMQKSTQSDRMGKDGQKSTQSGQMGKDSKSQMSKDQGAKSGTTVGAAGSGGVNLTTEQRTTLRQEVLTTSAPRVDDINFSVSVGTVVPRTVRVVEVPPAIVRIRPAWRGYRYFVYNDEIVIVEPRSLKIVAVLDV
jgi:hypothetical protein